ncbi:MAG: hypothetical protein KF716_01545 [Anaerolineae bacterium]|nr:hypothetical protein [Anaerolineae bacterium]
MKRITGLANILTNILILVISLQVIPPLSTGWRLMAAIGLTLLIVVAMRQVVVKPYRTL